jgi:tetratricopeptide (TPR) repeat protein/transglutaminase-like putative cysteine protease
MPVFRLWLTLAILVSPFAPAFAAKEWPVPRGPSHEPDPYTYDPADWKTVPKDFLDDAPACFLRASSTSLVEADGTTETIVHEVVRLNSRKAIEDLGEHRGMTFVPEFETLTLNLARVHKPDGTVVEVEPKHVQLRDTGTDFLVYDVSKQLIVSFPSLAAGDVIEVKWTVRGKNPEYHGHFFAQYQFGDDRYPVVRDVLRVRLPRDRALKYAAVNAHLAGGPLEPTVREADGQRTYTWESKNRRQPPRGDHLPSREELRPGVAVSTMQTWDQVRDWKRTIRANCWECTADIKKIVAEVTKGLDKPADKARALTYWVRRNVRYISSGEHHDFTPDPPAVVVCNRYGDCKDTSQLLAVLLKEAGIPSALVTLSVRGDGQIAETVPSPVGTHAILMATIDGKDHWIDTTASLYGWDFLPDADRDRLTYVVDDKRLRLLRTPKLTPDDDRTVLETAVEVRRNGDAVFDRRCKYTGLAAVRRRDDWVDVPNGERRRLMAAELLDGQSRARLKALEIDEAALKDDDAPVKARIVFEVPGHLAGDDLQEGSLSDAVVWNRILSVNIDPDRAVAVDLGAPFESGHRYTITVPPGRRLVDPPADHTCASKWGVFRRTVKADPGGRTWAIQFDARVSGTRVEPKDFDAFRRWQEEVATAYRLALSMRTVTDPEAAAADAKVLADALRATPGDRDGWAELIRLHDIAAEYDSAARAADDAVERFPDDRGILEAAARTARDPERAQMFWGALIRRYPKETEYPLALARDLITFASPAKAEPILKRLARHGDDTVRAQAEFQLARMALGEDDAAEARKHLAAARRADPEVAQSFTGHMLDGDICERLKDFKEAADAYRQAAAADPDNTEPLRALVRVLISAGEAAEAKAVLRRWVVMAEDDPVDLARAADAHLALGNDAEATDLAKRAADGDAGSVAARVLGIAEARQGDWERAVTDLKAVRPPDYTPEAFRAWAAAVVALGRLSDLPSGPGKLLGEEATKAEAVDYLALIDRAAALRKRAPEDRAKVIEQFVCAEYLVRRQRHPKDADRLLATVLRAWPDFGPALALRAEDALDRGRLRQALPDAERAVRVSPDEPRGYFVRGRVELERDNAEAAIRDLNRAVELSHENDGRSLHWLAAALAQAGRKDQALQIQEKAARLLPKDPEVLELLKNLRASK